MEYFKKSGKWYMTETLDVPVGLTFYELRSWIEKKRPYKDEFHMVINNDYANEIIGYPMLDLAN